jgi:hypothetical protein
MYLSGDYRQKANESLQGKLYGAAAHLPLEFRQLGVFRQGLTSHEQQESPGCR